jgi:hypothetical protein
LDFWAARARISNTPSILSEEAKMAKRMLLAVTVGLIAVPALNVAGARGDGLPVLGAEGIWQRVSVEHGQSRYVTVQGAHETLVKAISKDGRVLERRLSGRLTVPVVAYDGASAGLSAGGGTLVLIRPRVAFPQAATHLAILDPRTLGVRRYLRLNGDFSFDAISPNGRWIYLIQYTSPRDPTSYRVRALDARTWQLLRREIVDPHDRGEAMHGNPLARAGSPDGRWAYTLYDGNGHPFVHALDTEGLRARCIDLPAFPPGSDWWGARVTLVPGRHRLLVTYGPRTLSALDTDTLAVTVPGRRPPAKPQAAAAGNAGTLGIAFPVALVVLILGGGGLAVRRRLTASCD